MTGQDLKAQERRLKNQPPTAPERLQEEEDGDDEQEVVVPATSQREPQPSTAPERLEEGDSRAKEEANGQHGILEARHAGL